MPVNKKKTEILKVAVNAPLSRLFDYLPPAEGPTAVPGCRIRVPFGRQQITATVLEIATSTDVPRSKLRRATCLVDEQPLFGADDLWLIRFTSDYYHHPIGEVAAAAMPALLRKGRALYGTTEHLSLTEAGEATDLEALAVRAPKQAELLTYLHDHPGIDADELDALLPGWRRVRKSLLEKSLLSVDLRAEAVATFGTIDDAQPGPPLNLDQASARDAIGEAASYETVLLDGVTGSGKTEVYLHLIEKTLRRDQQVLVIVPEIGLTPQLLRRLSRRLGFAPALLHSSLPETERLGAWRAARDGSAPLLLGTRSAIFTPLKNLGLVVVDEEHDSSLKQQEGLRYSARDLAIARAKHLDIPVVLGSATPSLETLQKCHSKAYRHLSLPARAGNAAPPFLRLVDMSAYPLDAGVSDQVIKAIGKHLTRKGQVLVFLNRRGFAPTLICAACNKIAECGRCDARMTVHANDNALICHHCGATRPLDDACADCGGPCRPLGQGTQRLEEALATQFAGQSIARIDSDSTRAKGTIDKALALATSGETRILVGTQMLSKGHHFPNLTLVVVVNADQGLFSTDFRGSERLAQSLVQVAGRAGRERVQGEVLIQTAFPEHPFWRELISGGYERVAASALAEREAAAWPPFSRLALVRAAANSRKAAQAFLAAARHYAESSKEPEVRILGPVSAPMERRAGRFRAQLLLQSINRQALHRVLHELRVSLEDDALARRVRWSIDVDPIELF